MKIGGVRFLYSLVGLGLIIGLIWRKTEFIDYFLSFLTLLMQFSDSLFLLVQLFLPREPRLLFYLRFSKAVRMLFRGYDVVSLDDFNFSLLFSANI